MLEIFSHNLLKTLIFATTMFVVNIQDDPLKRNRDVVSVQTKIWYNIMFNKITIPNFKNEGIPVIPEVNTNLQVVILN